MGRHTGASYSRCATGGDAGDPPFGVSFSRLREGRNWHVLHESSEVFQWMCVKRFCELFDEASVPNERLPAFFKEHTIFGEYPAVHFSADMALLPQIQPGTSSSALYASPLIEAETANVEDWPKLMREISRLLDSQQDGSFCFKFRPQSLSTDALLVTRTRGVLDALNGSILRGFQVGKKRPRVVDCDARTLTIGLVVRALDGATSGVDLLNLECKRFNAMFENVDEDVRTAFGTMTNVLVVGVTGSSEKLKNMNTAGSMRKLMEDCEHVRDVVLLDLTTAENRAAFFGLVGSDKEKQLLIGSVNKFVD